MSPGGPRIQSRIVATQGQGEKGAVFDLVDPVTGRRARLAELEYSLVRQMDGRPLDELAGWALRTMGVEIKRDQIENLVERLRGLGLVETSDDEEVDLESTIGYVPPPDLLDAATPPPRPMQPEDDLELTREEGPTPELLNRSRR